jgi:spermidine synthase
VPTYYGGVMTFAWGSDNTALRTVPLDELQHRFESAGFKTRYYSPQVHIASFALPQYIVDALG